MAEHIIPHRMAIMMPEASAYHMDYLRDSPEKFTDETRTFLEVGAAQLATDYINALRLRTLIQPHGGTCSLRSTCCSHPPCRGRGPAIRSLHQVG